jgi:DNA/RNA-binding domain of Phe-tRNA-synthetase-like protein
MYFQHAKEIWAGYPELVAGVVLAGGVSADAVVGLRVARFVATAQDRLASGSESEFPEIRAWRRAFSRMGLKPTQYRCASESLLRRLRKEGELPRVHPLIDVCNAVSVAFAIPVAVFDVARIRDGLEVRPATGEERYETFSGQLERPDPGEVIFADAAGQAHARRWTNRQSGHSAVREGTTTVLIVAEAMHDSAAADVPELTATIARELAGGWPVTPRTALLSQSSPRFE